MRTESMSVSLVVSNAPKASAFLCKVFGFKQKYQNDDLSYNINTSINFPIAFLNQGSKLLKETSLKDIAKGITIEFIVNDLELQYERIKGLTEVSELSKDNHGRLYFKVRYRNITYRMKETDKRLIKVNLDKNRVIIEAIHLLLNVNSIADSFDFLTSNFDYSGTDGVVIIDLYNSNSTSITFTNYPDEDPASGIIIGLVADDVELEIKKLKDNTSSIFKDLNYDPKGETFYEIKDANGILYQPLEWAKPNTTKYINNSVSGITSGSLSYEKQEFQSDKDYIEIRGARENNLKNINVKIPKRMITVFTGVSGSGKSSIVFDTLAQESGRQLNETYSSFVRFYLPKYRQPQADAILNISPAIVIDQKRMGGNARSTLGTISDINSLLRLLFSRFATPCLGYANFYSFNDPNGMCLECEGIGKINTLNLELALDKEKSLNEGAILLPGYNVGGWQWKVYAGAFDPDKKLKDYTEEEMEYLLNGYTKGSGSLVDGLNLTYEGIVLKFIRQNFKTDREKSSATLKKTEKYTTSCVCPSCKGTRYNPKVLESRINSYSIPDLTKMEVDDLVEVLKSIQIPAAAPILKDLVDKVQSLIDIGLDYVNLDRETSTLSGGESQRVKMIKHLTSSLTDVLYIFDEPSIGLHPRDVHRLNELLIKIRDKGNTVIVVEHDPDVIKIADHIIDVGPHAGEHGGEIMFSGSLSELANSDTLTSQHLYRHTTIKASIRTSQEYYTSSRSSLHNLKDVQLKVPKGILTLVTGVAGSGKSTLVNKVFAQEFDQVVSINQASITANSRANPATYIGISDEIRKIFAKENQVKDSLFSANSDGGCPNCKGSGTVEINLSFMELMEVDCEVCGGKRFKEEVLQYKYKDKNILDVLNMTVEEAFDFFEKKSIKLHLEHLKDVGLGYITLGQPLNTLSGGECQRLKLASELTNKGNIYILDEPTTGLHMSDITNLLLIIDKLIEKGNTVIVIEHNLEVIKQADWIIDIGPEGGNKGGEIIFEGTLKDILTCEKSITAKYLKN